MSIIPNSPPHSALSTPHSPPHSALRTQHSALSTLPRTPHFPLLHQRLHDNPDTHQQSRDIIAHSDIVGYAPAELQDGGITAGTCFIPISAQKVDLTEISVNGYDGATKGEVYVQTLNEFGHNTANYYWYDYTDKKGKHIIGWLDDDDEEIEKETVEFQAGEGLWAMSDGDGFGLQSAGQVATSSVVVELQDGGLSVANPTPVDCDLTKCVITGYDGATKGEVYVQTLNEFGHNTANYYWYDYTDKKGKQIIGWLDDDDEEIEEDAVIIKPGVGIWTMSDGDGFNFVWPGVDVK